MNAVIPLHGTSEVEASSDFQLDIELLQHAISQTKTSQRSIMAELAHLTGQEEKSLIPELAAIFGMQSLSARDLQTLTPALEHLPLSTAIQRRLILLRNESNKILGVISQPFDPDEQTWLTAQAGEPIELFLAHEEDILAYLAEKEASANTLDNLKQISSDTPRDNKNATVLSYASISEMGSPAVKLVNSTLYDALKAAASDVHLESTAEGLSIKYRIDGVLDEVASFSGMEIAEHVISRLKVLAELDIAERRIPQDGSFQVQAHGRDIDLRLSIMPSIHGEDAVIRILDKQAMVEAYGALTLEALGFDIPSLTSIRTLSEEAYGMLLVTGPTGSGKTTTLYATLTEIHNGRDKIITIEDPVEYQLPGILQIPVNERKGLTFAKGLRSILRHDPDKIMVGEIRDKETAEIAVQSALTGHLVLTTVHANNVFDVFGRFTHMGIDPYAFLSALNGILAQRLIRLNCPFCSSPYQPSEQELARVGLNSTDLTEYSFARGKGCVECRDTGYKGRRAIAEILILTDEIRETIINKEPIRQIKEAARRNGTRSLREVAVELVKRGETTLDEIKRITLHA